jgi:gliding motility-associated-like protein
VTLFPISTSIFSVDPIICIDSTSTINYNGTASANAIFTWDFDGGNIISGNESGPFEIDWDIAGNYNITLTVEENGCMSTQSLGNVVVVNPIPSPVINCNSTTSTVTFIWDDVNGATSYQVNDLSGNGGMTIGNSYMVSGLANGEEVIIEVTAFGNNACGPTTVQASCTADDCPSMDVMIDHVDSICLTPNTPTFNFTATTSGGNNSGNMTWTGNGIIDGVTGLFDPNVAGVGVHDITLGYEESNCFYFDVVTIQIFEIPTADFSVDNLICVNDNSTITYLGTGSSNASYIWSFNGVNIISGNGLGPYLLNWSTAGNYNITLTVEENGCQSALFSQNITVDPILDLPVVTCVSSTQSIIFSWENVPNATDYLVTEVSGPSGIQNGNTYEVTGMTTGEEVVIEVTAIGSTTCGNSTVQATCTANDCPFINVEVEEVTAICLTQNTAPINLNVVVSGSNNSGNGVWSGTGITDIDLSVFDPMTAGVGSHNITFTFEEEGCTFSDFITIEVFETPIADFSIDDNICINENTMVNYLGSVTTNANYIWDFAGGTILSGSGGGPFEISWPDSGNYNITLTVEENGCNSTIFSQNVQVDASLAIPNITCESTTQSITFLWDDIAGATDFSINELSGINGVQNGNSIVYNNLLPGQEIAIEVTAVGNTICGNTTVMATCFANDCPNVELIILPIDDVCLTNLSPPIPLQITVNGSDGTGVGNWSGNGIVNDIFDPNIAGGGQHELTYSFTEIQCDFSISIFVNVNLQPIVEAGEDGHLDCGDTLIILDGSNSSVFGSPIWTTNNGNIVNGFNSLSAEVNAPGVYYLTIENSVCTSIDSVVVTQNISIPIAAAGLDIELDCNETEAILGSENTSSGVNFVYLWTSSNPTISINSSTDLNPIVDGLGTYNLLVTNLENGCTSIDVIQVSQSPNIPQNINLEILESPCHGDDQGMIMIPFIDGGLPPYVYSLNGNPFSSSNVYTNLPIGDYDILIQDANGCELSTMVTMSQPDFLSIDLGENIYIELGDSVMLDPSVVGVFDTIVWEYSTNYSNCDTLENCFFPIVTPTQTAQVMATIMNDDGCIAMDQITIFVEKNRYVYIPNAFAPEGNSDNQIFMIYVGKGVKKINTFKVFSRWGEQLYAARNFYPNDNSYGWDGKFKGEKMNPGVYIYFVEIEFSDGLKIIYNGDVTLTR